MDNKPVSDLNETHLKPIRKFGPAERAVAFLLIVAGYLFKIFVVDGDYAIGAVVGIYLLYICGTVLVFARGGKLCKGAVAFYVLGAVFPLSLLISSSPLVCLLVKLYSTVIYLASVYYAFGNTVGEKFGDMMFYEAVKAVFVMPFMALGAWFSSLFSAKNGTKAKTTAIAAIGGLLLALVPTAVVVSLLSYDANFSRILRSISLENVSCVIGNLLFAAAFSVLVFGDVVASSEHLACDIMTREKCTRLSVRSKVIPTALTVAFVLPLIAVYAVFFISQWDYYVSAFTGKLPETLSYAEYARKGFFELCSVSAINGAFLLIIELFGARPYGKRPIAVKVVGTVLSVSTLALIATAMSKMILYIDMYGLTKRRVYSSWFMILLALYFIILTVAQFTRMRILPSVLAASSLMLAVLAFSGVDARIAEYNVTAYIDGRLSSVDIASMYELSDDAVPYVVSLLDYDIDRDTRKAIERYGNKAASDITADGVFHWNIPRAKARKALEKHGFLK